MDFYPAVPSAQLVRKATIVLNTNLPTHNRYGSTLVPIELVWFLRRKQTIAAPCWPTPARHVGRLCPASLKLRKETATLFCYYLPRPTVLTLIRNRSPSQVVFRAQGWPDAELGTGPPTEQRFCDV